MFFTLPRGSNIPIDCLTNTFCEIGRFHRNFTRRTDPFIACRSFCIFYSQSTRRTSATERTGCAFCFLDDFINACFGRFLFHHTHSLKSLLDSNNMLAQCLRATGGYNRPFHCHLFVRLVVPRSQSHQGIHQMVR